MTKWLPDGLVIAGIGAVVVGVYQAFPPAAWIVGGLSLAVCGVGPLVMARQKKHEQEERDWRIPR